MLIYQFLCVGTRLIKPRYPKYTLLFIVAYDVVAIPAIYSTRRVSSTISIHATRTRRFILVCFYARRWFSPPSVPSTARISTLCSRYNSRFAFVRCTRGDAECLVWRVAWLPQESSIKQQRKRREAESLDGREIERSTYTPAQKFGAPFTCFFFFFFSFFFATNLVRFSRKQECCNCNFEFGESFAFWTKPAVFVHFSEKQGYRDYNFIV